MKEHEKAFLDYCKGYKFREIAAKRNVTLATVKTWSQRGIEGMKWNEAKRICTDEETGEINLKKASRMVKGAGNLSPVKAGQLKYPSQYPDELTKDKQLVSSILKECCMYYDIEIPQTETELKQRITIYFSNCIDYGIIPTVEGLANALGMSKVYLWELEQGKRGTVRANAIKLAKQQISEFDAKLAMQGKLKDSVYIFRAKNFYGMRDVVEQVATINDPLGDKKDKEKILERLESLSDE